uniref:ARAD1C21758p n=1 Tax=Blastobotrys adeninivorans TaxID=409370 RepID=A0A060T226_BLAAD
MSGVARKIGRFLFGGTQKEDGARSPTPAGKSASVVEKGTVLLSDSEDGADGEVPASAPAAVGVNEHSDDDEVPATQITRVPDTERSSDATIRRHDGGDDTQDSSQNVTQNTVPVEEDSGDEDARRFRYKKQQKDYTDAEDAAAILATAHPVFNSLRAKEKYTVLGRAINHPMRSVDRRYRLQKYQKTLRNQMSPVELARFLQKSPVLISFDENIRALAESERAQRPEFHTSEYRLFIQFLTEDIPPSENYRKHLPVIARKMGIGIQALREKVDKKWHGSFIDEGYRVGSHYMVSGGASHQPSEEEEEGLFVQDDSDEAMFRDDFAPRQSGYLSHEEHEESEEFEQHKEQERSEESEKHDAHGDHEEHRRLSSPKSGFELLEKLDKPNGSQNSPPSAQRVPATAHKRSQKPVIKPSQPFSPAEFYTVPESRQSVADSVPSTKAQQSAPDRVSGSHEPVLSGQSTPAKAKRQPQAPPAATETVSSISIRLSDSSDDDDIRLSQLQWPSSDSDVPLSRLRRSIGSKSTSIPSKRRKIDRKEPPVRARQTRNQVLESQSQPAPEVPSWSTDPRELRSSPVELPLSQSMLRPLSVESSSDNDAGSEESVFVNRIDDSEEEHPFTGGLFSDEEDEPEDTTKRDVIEDSFERGLSMPRQPSDKVQEQTNNEGGQKAGELPAEHREPEPPVAQPVAMPAKEPHAIVVSDIMKMFPQDEISALVEDVEEALRMSSIGSQASDEQVSRAVVLSLFDFHRARHLLTQELQGGAAPEGEGFVSLEELNSLVNYLLEHHQVPSETIKKHGLRKVSRIVKYITKLMM